MSAAPAPITVKVDPTISFYAKRIVNFGMLANAISEGGALAAWDLKQAGREAVMVEVRIHVAPPKSE